MSRLSPRFHSGPGVKASNGSSQAVEETYPGYYKFHTTDELGNPGMDIMVNGYNGGIWMNTHLGVPIKQIQ